MKEILRSKIAFSNTTDNNSETWNRTTKAPESEMCHRIWVELGDQNLNDQ